MPKYRRGLLIGRFQPFHKGHRYLLLECAKLAEKLIIGIGTPLIKNRNTDPFSFEVRKAMLEAVIKAEKLTGSVIKILPVYDFLDSDDKWYAEMIKAVGEFDVYFGNDEWTTGIFEKHGHTVGRFPFFKRNLYEGKKIRRLIETKGQWQERVPEYTISIVKSKCQNSNFK